MSDALDAVLAIRREKLLRDQQTSESINQGFSNFVDAFVKGRTLQQGERKNEIDMLLAQAKLQEAQVQSKLLSQILGGAQGSGSFQPKGFTAGGLTFEDPAFAQREQKMKDEAALQLEREKEAIKGVGAESSGRVALAQESLKNIDDAIKELFPDGTPKSFRRDVAFGSNVPGSTAPLIGTVIPETVPFGEKGQTVFRKVGAALSGRQLIQTGVASRPEETAKLVSQFAPSWASNPKAALEGLRELKTFYKLYLAEIDPQKVKRASVKSDFGETPSGIKYKVK